MTVSVTTAITKVTGDGAKTPIPTVFVFSTEADIEVIERVIATGVETTKSLTTDYLVIGGGGTGVPDEGTVTPVNNVPTTVEWHVRRVVAETQGTALPVAGALPSTAIEKMADRVTMEVQQHSEELGRTLSFPKTDSDTLDPTIPNSVERSSKYLTFDSSGNPTASAGASNLEDGTESAPALFFKSEPGTGFYLVAAGNIGFSINGTKAFQLNGGELSITGKISADGGSAGAPGSTIVGDTDTGRFSPGADTLAWSTNGAERTRIDSTGRFLQAKTASASIGTAGIELGASTEGLMVTTTAARPGRFNRLTDDGDILEFYQDGTEEGAITVSGTTVSLTAFVGAHPSLWDPDFKPAIDPPVGTVVTTTERMCEWLIDRVYDADSGDFLRHANRHERRKKIGEETITDIPEKREGRKLVEKARRERSVVEKYNNKRLLSIKVSDTKDEVCYGIYAGTNRDNGNQIVWGVGLCGEYGARITGPFTRGDWLSSYGDGTLYSTGAKRGDNDVARALTSNKGAGAVEENMVLCILHCG